MSEFAPALRRFWPVLVAGVVFASLAVMAAIYDLPSLDKRSTYEYTASSRLLVTGAQAPYIRTSVTRVVEEPARGPTGVPTTTEVVDTPDVAPYVRAANLYPILVESDEVQRYRTKLFGQMEGIVSSSAIYQVATAARFRPSEVPVLQVFGTASTPKKALRLTTKTADAFIAWIVAGQQTSGVPANQRIIVQQLERPKPSEVTRSGGTAIGLLMLIFGAVVAAFALLAIILDRLRPKGSADEEAEETTDAAVASAPLKLEGETVGTRRRRRESIPRIEPGVKPGSKAQSERLGG